MIKEVKALINQIFINDEYSSNEDVNIMLSQTRNFSIVK